MVVEAVPIGTIPDPADPGGGPRAGDPADPGGSFRFLPFPCSGPCNEGSRGRWAEDGEGGIGGYVWYPVGGM